MVRVVNAEPAGTWPRSMPGIGPTLTTEQELACALRILAAEGWQENLSGHITVAGPDGSLLVNPWGMWWEEVCASDIVRIDANGVVVSGRWDVTPAVHLHTELHRARADARVVVHNHPHHATLLACAGIEPVISHQNAALLDGELAFVDEYDGTVESSTAGVWLAARVGAASTALLANHGAIVTGSDFAIACYRAVVLERACTATVEALQAGVKLRELPVDGRAALKAELQRNAPPAYWGGAVRLLLAREPEVIT